MQEMVTSQDDLSRQKSMSFFKKELANVLKNRPSGKPHRQTKPDNQIVTVIDSDYELYQDTSTLQVLNLPWKNAPVLAELAAKPTSTNLSAVSLGSIVEQPSRNGLLRRIPALMADPIRDGPEEEEQLELDQSSTSHVVEPFEMEELTRSKPDVISTEEKHNPRNFVCQQGTSQQIQMKRKEYGSPENFSSSNDDDNANESASQVQYSKLQGPAEQRKSLLSKFSFGKSKSNAIAVQSVVEDSQRAEATFKIAVEEIGETPDFNSVAYKENTSQKRGILGIGGHLRKSLFKRRSRGRVGDERNKEGPLQQIRPDDEANSDLENEEVLVFAPASQTTNDNIGFTPLPSTTTEITSEESRAMSQYELNVKGSKWYFKSAEELSRATGSSLTHISQTTLHSAPEEALYRGDGCKDSETKPQKSENVKKSAPSIFYKRAGTAQDASIEAQQALEVLHQAEGLDVREVDDPNEEDSDNGLRQYFEDVIPNQAEESKKGKALGDAFHWFRRKGKKKTASKPEVIVELVSPPKTCNVGVQFPEVDEQSLQNDADNSQSPPDPSNHEQRSDSRSTIVSQELLWKVPEESTSETQPSNLTVTDTEEEGHDASAEVVFRCPSALEEFPVVQATHPAVNDYVPGDSLLTLSSLDVHEHTIPPSMNTQSSVNLIKPAKIPIFAACCPAPNNNKPNDISIPYGCVSMKDTPGGKRRSKGKEDEFSSRRSISAMSSGKKGANSTENSARCSKVAVNDAKKREKHLNKDKVGGQKESSLNPAVAIVKTVAKQVVFKLREREQRKKRNRSVRGVDLVKTRQWCSCPDLALKARAHSEMNILEPPKLRRASS